MTKISRGRIKRRPLNERPGSDQVRTPQQRRRRASSAARRERRRSRGFRTRRHRPRRAGPGGDKFDGRLSRRRDDGICCGSALTPRCSTRCWRSAACSAGRFKAMGHRAPAHGGPPVEDSARHKSCGNARGSASPGRKGRGSPGSFAKGQSGRAQAARPSATGAQRDGRLARGSGARPGHHGFVSAAAAAVGRRPWVTSR